MSYYTIARLTSAEHSALRNAVVMGALAARQATLRTLISANRGHQIADTYENELRALERVAHAVVDAKYVD